MEEIFTVFNFLVTISAFFQGTDSIRSYSGSFNLLKRTLGYVANCADNFG